MYWFAPEAVYHTNPLLQLQESTVGFVPSEFDTLPHALTHLLIWGNTVLHSKPVLHKHAVESVGLCAPVECVSVEQSLTHVDDVVSQVKPDAQLHCTSFTRVAKVFGRPEHTLTHLF